MNEKQLKTIKGAKYRVVTGDDCVFPKGAMIQLADDSVVDEDGAEYTQEGNSYGSHYMYFHEIELVELPENVLGGDIAAALTKVVALEERVEVLEQAEETPEPLYAVGQKLRVKGNEHPIMHLFRLGTEVEVLEVHRAGNEYLTEPDSVRYDYLTEPVVGGFTQFISEDDLEPMEQSHISEEEFAAIKVGDKIVLRSDLEVGGEYGAESVTSEMADLAKREVEITVERISTDVLRGDAEEDFWRYTAEMIAKVIPAIKPKFKVGDIINRPEYGDSLYYARLVIEVDADNGTYVMRWADGSHPDFRMEYSFDETESAFIKKEGLPPRMINPKGTVITAGSYYAAEGTLYDVVLKVTEVQPESAEWAYIVTSASGRLSEDGFQSVTGSAYFATAVPATSEQIEKFQQLENPETAEEKAPEFDNPEVEVGKVYMDDDGWMFYCDTLSKVTTSDTPYGRIYVDSVTALDADGELELEANYGCDNYREATQEEANKLLGAVIQQKAA